MKRLFLPVLLFLAACATTQTAQTLLGANALYTAASEAGETAVKAGTLDKAKFKDLDNKAYAALVAFREGRITIEQFREALKPLEAN